MQHRCVPVGLFFALLNSSALALSQPTANANIIGGSEVSNVSSPSYLHTVRLLNTGTIASQGVPPEYAGKKFTWSCSGTLITSTVIVTAAHCFPAGLLIQSSENEKTPKLLPYASIKGEVYFKLNPRDDKLMGARVVSFVRHAEFSDSWMYSFPEIWNPASPVNDVAVARLDYAAPKFKQPVSLIASDDILESGSTILLAGYGRSEHGGESAMPTLRETKVPFVRSLNNHTDAFVGEGNTEKPGTVSNPSGACYGDSGGPAYLVENGTTKLAGVIVRGPDAENGGCMSSVTIITDLRRYTTWIQNAMQDL